ncbi:NADP-dependent oxidoreductase [Egicoccus halophilus]|uniref:Oxidoreductase n=1 Tax=Egicoccus halophilus TaxID=1670830 RepID=A0A8J3EY34_9ACTN|nr:NADP-dependent oxidoreductase [Egicoccus halophilus]GGI07063.1 oxidoreductase [Egicoccus halophilus]
MRAVVADEYGGPDVLQVRELDDPRVGPDDVLVRVRAASINPVDYKIVEGHLDAAWPVLWPLVPGWDVAGEVVGAGPAVRHVEVGQQVFGYARKDVVGTGTWAELVAVPARGVAPAPASLDAVAAGCLPLAGMTAWQALVEDLEVSEGDTLLIHAATGGVGHLATQIAVARGARVIGTCSEPNHDFLRELGGEPVTYGDGLADRLRELAPEGVTAVADFVADGALEASDEVLTKPGRVVSILDPQAAAERGGSYVFVRPDVAHLTALAELADAGRLTPHVQSVHDLDAVRDAVAEASGGSVRGKVVLRVP